MAISNNRFAENISVDNGNVLNGLVSIGAKQRDLFSANGDNSYNDDLYGRDFPYYGVELAKKSLSEIIEIMGGYFDVKWANDVVYAPGNRIYVSNEYVLPGMWFFIGDATRLFDSGEYGNDINIALTKIKKDILDGKYKKFDYVNVRTDGILDSNISPGMKYIDFCEAIGGYPPARVGGQSEISNVGQYVYNYDDDLDFVLALYDDVDVDYNEEVPVATMKKLNPSINQFIVQSKNSGQNTNVVNKNKDFEYEIRNGKAVIVKYIGKDRDFVIPSVIDGYKVKIVDDNNWYGNYSNVKNIVVSEGIKSVLNWEFHNFPSVETVTLPSTIDLNVGWFNYSGKKLKRIKFSKPHSRYCVVNGVVYDNRDNTLLLCPCKKTFKKGKYTIRKGTKTIQARAFCGNKTIKKLIMPNTVKCIGESAFFGCKELKYIKISKNIRQMFFNCFGGCKSLKSVTIPRTVKGFYYDNSIVDVSLGYNGTKKIKGFALYGYRGSQAERYAKEKDLTFRTAKAKQPFVVKTVNRTIKSAKLRLANQTVKKAIVVKSNKGTVTYAKVNSELSNELTISPKGIITVLKGRYKKDTTLKMKVRVTSRGNKYYKSSSKIVTVNIKVK